MISKTALYVFLLTCVTGWTVWGDLAPIDYWDNMSNVAPFPAGNERGEVFYYSDTVTLREQKLDIQFVYPNRVIVRSSYEFVVYEPDQEMTVGFFPDKFYLGGKATYPKNREFEVFFKGGRISTDLVEFSDRYELLVFPIDFGEAGDCDLTIKNTYTVGKNFDKLKKSKTRPTFRYDFSPAVYWEGNVERIYVTFDFIGGEISQLSVVGPRDFSFVESGCEWVWENVQDEELVDKAIYLGYGDAGLRGGWFETVDVEEGLEVREGPGDDYTLIRKLPNGTRFFSTGKWPDEEPVYEEDGTIWWKCRLDDNKEGWYKRFDKHKATVKG